jgi:hypothetical protein
VTVGGLGVTAKYFPPVPGPSIGVASTKVGYIYYPGQNRANNQLIHVMALGNVTPDPLIACPTFRVELVATTNPTAAAPTYTTICDSTADALGEFSGDATASQPWMIDAWMQLDGTSGQLQGHFTAMVGNDVDAQNVALSSALINVNESIDPPIALAVRVTFGTTGAGNSASMYQLALEQ